jgi:tetratricopeptide (TPR) repeat protein
MKCPVCRAIYRSSGKGENVNFPSEHLCRRCGGDLTSLIHLHDQAIWHHRQAIQALQSGDYQGSMHRNNQALALYANHADFHALAGQLWALQGEFEAAIAAWQKAQQLSPQHPTASACLQFFATPDLCNL